ncbi:MAG: hypothetical protein QOE06_3696 [Thermoleophilaceae bacterium]|nr:hypothetical protein [Thermoleophilaceae bacterium]
MSGPRNSEVAALADALANLELPEMQRQALQARYISYIGWLERAATRSRRAHYLMRLTAAIGGVIVTAMSSAEVLGSPAGAVKWILLGTSLTVGVALAFDGFLNLGERWRHYRRAVEALKSQGWRLVQRTEPYLSLSDADAARTFAARVEDLIDEESGGYVRGPARPAAGPTTAQPGG